MRIPRLSAAATPPWPDISPLIGAGALAAVTIVGILVIRRQDQLTRDRQRTVYALTFPADLTAEQATAFVRSLTGLRPPRRWLLGRDSVVFEIVGRSDGIEHRLRLPSHQSEPVLGQLRTLVPGVRVKRLDAASLPDMDVACELAVTSLVQPLRTDQAEAFAGSLLSGLGLVSPHGTEVVTYQLVVFPFRSPTSLPTRGAASVGSGQGWLRSLAEAFAGSRPAGGESLAAQRLKNSEPLFGVVARVGARSAAHGRSGHLVGRVVGTLHQVDAPGVRIVSRGTAPQLSVLPVSGADS